MPTEFVLPDIGEGTATGEIVEWHVAVGDQVREDQPMVDVQTDKAIVTIPCPMSGMVLRIVAAEGETVPVGDVVIVFGKPGDVIAEGDKLQAPASHRRKTLASPAVRSRARTDGIDLATVVATGPGGRVTREDVSAVAPARAAHPSTTDDVRPLRGTRRLIARNLTESWRTIPHVLDFREVEVAALSEVRGALKARAETQGDRQLAKALTPFALLAKIAADVVRRHPAVRSSVDMEREEITHYANVDLSVAVATPDGLVTVVIPRGDELTLSDLAREIARLAAAARNRRLSPDQLRGGTFTINNYGSLGSPLSTNLIPPRQSAHLGFGHAEEKAVVRDGRIVARPMMWLSCAGDHRAMDGAELQAFVNDLVECIEKPVLLWDP